MNQTQHAATGRGTSQCEKIAAMLIAKNNEWVPMPDLWKASGAFAVHSRIADLRKRGMSIAHRNERAQDGSIHSFYRLDPAQP